MDFDNKNISPLAEAIAAIMGFVNYRFVNTDEAKKAALKIMGLLPKGESL